MLPLSPIYKYYMFGVIKSVGQQQSDKLTKSVVLVHIDWEAAGTTYRPQEAAVG